ncbi:uncharacterized protein [Amphiura filiformis]|uniref:uncharacterized protein n=1 Tax=Amphiura filiformis TaxID=82378 RepID=UPI003B21ED6D
MIEDMMDDLPIQQIKELRFVMLGRTGAGMTTTANNILQEKIFEERVDTRSKTQLCEFVQRKVDGRRFTIIDTPGFYNTERPQKHTEWEIDRCVAMATPGPHAFLLVISMTNRFPPEAQETIRRMEAKFGSEVYNHLIVVFTGKDTLDNENRTFTDFLQNGIHPMVEDVLRKCSQRCVAFNNKADKEENAIQVKTLLDVIDRMVAQNGGGFYSTEKFASTVQKLRRKMASCLTAVGELFHFNLTTFYVLVGILMLFTLLIPILTVVWSWQFRPSRPSFEPPHIVTNNTTEPIMPPKTNLTELESEPEMVPEPKPELPELHTYFYSQVLLGSVGRGVCSLNEDTICLTDHWFHPLKPPPIDMLTNIYPTVMLNAVQRSWSLITEECQTGQGYYEPEKTRMETFRGWFSQVYNYVAGADTGGPSCWGHPDPIPPKIKKDKGKEKKRLRKGKKQRERKGRKKTRS